MNTQPDKIDHYLRNEMSPAEVKDFESLISESPELKAEVNFQKNIVEGLQEYRKSQLKSRLAQIEVGPSTSLWQSSYAKIAGAVSVAAVIGIGAYVLSSDPEEAPQEMISSGGPLNIVQPSVPEVSEFTVIEKSEPARSVASEPKEKVAEPTIEVVEETIDESKKEFSLAVSVPGDQKIQEEQGFEVPGIKEELVEIEGEASKTQLEVEQQPSSDNKLSYRYFGGKLSLYGDFSGSPYEILEINTNKGRAVYLFFESKYFAISPTNEIVELDILDDPEVIEQLEIIRSEK